jgi:hypothetical protein
MSRDIPNYKFLEINIQTINDEIEYPKDYKNEKNDNQIMNPKITFILRQAYHLSFHPHRDKNK